MKRLSALLLLLLLTACSEGNIDDRPYPNELTWTNIGNAKEVVRLTIDGLDCVVAASASSGGVAISCDWNQS